jgi:hypothetical protein
MTAFKHLACAVSALAIRKDICKAVQAAMEARARLGAEDQSRWDGQFIEGLSKLTTVAERREKLAQIPQSYQK